MYVCMYVCLFVCLFVCIFVCMFACVLVCTYVRMYEYTSDDPVLPAKVFKAAYGLRRGSSVFVASTRGFQSGLFGPTWRLDFCLDFLCTRHCSGKCCGISPVCPAFLEIIRCTPVCAAFSGHVVQSQFAAFPGKASRQAALVEQLLETSGCPRGPQNATILRVVAIRARNIQITSIC
jgi:hypothetical protein